MKTQKKRLLLAATFLWGLVGCSLTGPVRDDPKAAETTFTAPSSARWIVLKDKDDADNAWVHKKTGSTLAVRSVCRRYEHLSLQVLSQNLINTLQEPEIQSQDSMTVAGRAALASTFVGTIDGVGIQNKLVVMRKDHCIFDFTLSQLSSIAPEVLQDFDAFMSTFRYEGGQAK